MVSYLLYHSKRKEASLVLILIVLDDGLVLPFTLTLLLITLLCLNPCCSGRWSSTLVWDWMKEDLIHVLILVVVDDGLVLDYSTSDGSVVYKVLILVVVDDGLVLELLASKRVKVSSVLILVVVDYGLVHRAGRFLKKVAGKS